MMTSYYAMMRHFPQGSVPVSIAGWPPKWYEGRVLRELYPKRWFFDKYKQDGDYKFYTLKYHEEVLSKLDPLEISMRIGDNGVLMCYEKSSDFCHRHIVATWLETTLGIKVPEFEK